MKKTFLVCFCAMALVACGGAAIPPLRPSPEPASTPTPTPAPKPTTMPTDLPIITRATPNAMIEWSLAALAPTEKDKTLLDGPVYIESKKITAANGAFVLELRGSLPTPCNMLRVVMDKPTADMRVNLKVYSVADPTRMCVDMIAPLNARINLGVLPPGGYSFTLNGEDMGKVSN